ncbi:hypothetical protein GGI15_004275 [Coemansia interrupta]|uniref:Ankyrin repeat-containing protein n=1 Tax=Coemansia interrupta TaxID=1126814 RepID=A0A9W8LFA5_9FUNG|nr:hypothetical protein GGI15_004275 [Coemansia interrupta]
MTADARSVDELIRSNSPLAGAEQQVLREWVAEWQFSASSFSPLAQPLIRGDPQALLAAHTALAASTSPTAASLAYSRMRETALRMPAMEVVIAGAQYYTAATGCGSRVGDYAGCLRFLHGVGVHVDGEDVAGFTAFMRASQTRASRLDLAATLLELGADVNHRSRFGGVALHEAIMAQDRAAVAFLRRNGADMDAKDHDGVSPRDIVSLIL